MVHTIFLSKFQFLETSETNIRDQRSYIRHQTLRLTRLGCPRRVNLLPGAIETSFLIAISWTLWEFQKFACWWLGNMLPVHNEAIVLPITASNLQPLHMGRFSSYLCHIFFHLQILLGTGCFDSHIWYFGLSAIPPWGMIKLWDHLNS